MPTMSELISSIQVELESAESRRNKSTAEIQLILNTSAAEGRSALTSEEDDRTKELFAKRDQAKLDITAIKSRLEIAQRARADELENEEASKSTRQTADRPSYDRVARVGREERTYHRGNDYSGGSFIRDVAKSFLYRDVQADFRLARHMEEERVERAEYLSRAAGTGAFTGLVVPQYLTDMYAPRVQALRPFADICNKHPLPADGMTVNISRITTGSSVALQASENTSVSNTDMDDTLLTENVQTAAGQQTLSRQAIDRGTGIEDVVLDDLFRAYATSLDSTLLNQATTGLTNVAATISYTDTSPTVAELYPKLSQANAAVEAGLLAQAVPSHVIMHSRRWHWMNSSVGAQWPFLSQPGVPVQAGGVNNGVGYNRGVRGILSNGNEVIVDNNIATNLGAGTNEDEIYVVAADECHLWEDPNAPVFIRAEQPAAGSLGVLLVVYGYFAYSFRRYSAGSAKLAGTGLVTPTFGG
jgi:HK97 family phage major capsid protein